MRSVAHPPCWLRNAGFTYIGLLFWVAVAGAGLAVVGEVWHAAAKREREQDLLFVGEQFRRAIGAYYESSPGTKHYPRRLEDLLADARTPVVRRHLRRIYPDPMTGKADWRLIMQGDQILGVFSRSQDQPIKRANFALADAFFSDGLTYSDWRFVYTPHGSPSAGVAALAADRQAVRASPLGSMLSAEPASDESRTSNADAVTAAAAQAQGAAPVDLPTEGWACTAAYANDTRACANDAGQKGVACGQAAKQKYGRCLSAAAGTGSLFANQ
jgi:type II secretory pathway pseudopilin PulG